MTQEVLFWTFSTIAQSFVALVSLLGMVGIYRIQIIKHDIGILANSIRPLIRQIRKDADGYTTNKIVKDVKGLAKSRKDLPAITKANNEFINFHKQIYHIKKEATHFICETLFVVAISIFGLFFTPLIAGTAFATIALIFIILISSMVLYSSYRFVRCMM